MDILKNNLEIISDLLWLYNKLCNENEDIKWAKKMKQKVGYLLFKNELFIHLVNNGFLPRNKNIIRDAKKQIRKQNQINMVHQKRRHERRKDFSLSDSEWEDTKLYFDDKCAYCGKFNKLTFDHFIPFSKGGKFTKSNILPACARCNSSKRDNDFKSWYRNQKYYDTERESKIYSFLESANKC